jgi:TRAP-type mannitol/chloroaromatic compound transport system permease small subunit
VGPFDALLNVLLPAARVIDAVNTWIGKRAAWLILAAVLVSSINATVRKAFDISSNAWLELQWILFSATFLFCSPWTLSSNEHIRVDILNNLMPRRVRDLIDVIGHAFFLLPFCAILIVTGAPFA